MTDLYLDYDIFPLGLLSNHVWVFRKMLGVIVPLKDYTMTIDFVILF